MRESPPFFTCVSGRVRYISYSANMLARGPEMAVGRRHGSRARTMAAAERLFLVSFFGPSHKPTPIISSSAAATAGPAKLGPPITVRTTVGSGSSAPLSQLESGCCEHWHGTRESAKGFPIEVKEWVRGSRASLKKDENGVGSAGETSSPRTLSPSAACPVLD